MSKWIEIAGSPDYVDMGAGRARLTRSFHTDIDNGVAEARAQGYFRGKRFVHNGAALQITSIQVVNDMGRDLVRIQADSPGSVVVHKGRQYNDPVARQDGDSEYYLELDIQSVEAQDAINIAGEAWSGTWGIDETTVVDQPGVILVWRKWMSKASKLPGVPPKTLPTTRFEALQALITYLPQVSEQPYEPGGPRIMHVLAASGTEAKLLCISINLESDGDLVCRVAKFRYNPLGWNSSLYGGM
jgi:hypothetical protein